MAFQPSKSFIKPKATETEYYNSLLIVASKHSDPVDSVGIFFPSAFAYSC